MPDDTNKKQADLVRHRELNALRRLMVRRGTAESLPPDQKLTRQSKSFESSSAINQIDALEVQMSLQLFKHRALTRGRSKDFQLTQIEPYDASAPATQMTAKTTEKLGVVQQAGNLFAENKVVLAQTILEQAIAERGAQHNRVPLWLALFDLYRASDQMDRFEVLALDFSIHFGRSPPSWTSIVKQAMLTVPVQTSPELYGTLDGARAADLLAQMTPKDGMLINCDRLVRCDPAATKLILRWAGLAKEQGLQLELQGLHRIVAAYFVSQGLAEHVKIRIRRD